MRGVSGVRPVEWIPGSLQKCDRLHSLEVLKKGEERKGKRERRRGTSLPLFLRTDSEVSDAAGASLGRVVGGPDSLSPCPTSGSVTVWGSGSVCVCVCEKEGPPDTRGHRACQDGLGPGDRHSGSRGDVGWVWSVGGADKGI